jgi:phosphatidylglycerophosphatase C
VDDEHTPRGSDHRLVFFDLDGTITRRDTLIGYVTGFALRHPFRLLGFIRALPALFAFLLGDRDRGRLKGALIHAVMGGASRAAVTEWTMRYVPRLLASGIFVEARECIDRHREAGDHLVLMSATVDLYVPELAAALGFDDHLCSGVQWSGDRLDGRLVTANVRDHEKARLLQAKAARLPGRRIMAYGNSQPDLPHLRLADEAVLVNPGKRLRKAATGSHFRFKKWK